MEAPCADAIMHQINHSPDSVVFDPYGSLRFEEMPSNAADIGSNRSDEITGHVHDYVPLPERFGGSSAPTKPDEALLCLPSDLSHLGSKRRGPRNQRPPRPAMATAAKGSAAAAAATAATATVAKGSTAAATARAAKGSAPAATATVAKAAVAKAAAPVTRLESTRRPASRPRTMPTERMLAGWTACGAISKPCSGDFSFAGMTELPPGTDHKVLVASIMAAVRGFTGYRGVPHLAVNRVGRFAPAAGAKAVSGPSHSGQSRATTDARQPPETESATERGPRRTHDADEQSSESRPGCREEAPLYLGRDV